MVEVRAPAPSLVAADPSPVSLWLPGFGVATGDPNAGLIITLAGDRDAKARQAVHVLLIEDDGAIGEMYRVQLE